MKVFSIVIQLLWYSKIGLPQRYTDWSAPWIEREHDPTRYTTAPSPYINGSRDRVPEPDESPDYRLEEPFRLPYAMGDYIEEQRPYRISPHYKMTSRWGEDSIRYAGCYCTTVFKRLTPLSGCAVITTRHVLTTATSTHLILRDRYHFPTMDNILGAWYDTDHNNYNSSMYLSPARIHYHPLWHYPEQVNRSHPFSFTFDLCVWATTYNVYGWYLNPSSTMVCLRATSHSREHGSPAPSNEMFVVVGFQYMYAYKRKPMPWYKYAVRTYKYTNPCPKTEWGWFICVPGDWAKYGVESGAALHRAFQGRSWRYDGFVGIAAFSMRLRSEEITHYFTVLDHHYVLDFLVDAYDSTIPYVWLDKRFYDSKYKAPRILSGYWIPRVYPLGYQNKYLTKSDK